MEVRQLRRHPADHPQVDGVAREEAVHHPRRRQPSHLDGVVDDLALAAETVGAVLLRDRPDAEVDAGAGPLVQPYFLLAEVAPPLERREVEEAEVDCLLQLEDAGLRQEDIGDVRLHELDRSDRERIGSRPQQGIYVRRQSSRRQRLCLAREP